MARPAGGYKTKDGTKVPGVTTIIGRFKDSGGLIFWAWEQGHNGFDFRETRDAAAEAGTVAHALVEYHITGKSDKEITTLIEEQRIKPEILEKAYRAYENYLNWENTTRLKVIKTEMSLVSEVHRFGGTYDGIAVVEIGEVKALADWKTGTRVYVEYLCQCAAYKGLWDEHNPEDKIEGGFHLCCFSRENGDFSHHYYTELNLAWDQFLLLRAAYDNDKILKKRVG